MLRLLSVLLCAVVPVSLSAQQPTRPDCGTNPADSTPKLKAEACLRLASDILSEDTKDASLAAIGYAHSAYQLALADKDHGIQGSALIFIATRYSRMARFDSSLAYGRRALAHGRQWGYSSLQAWALASLSIDYAELGRSDSAVSLGLEMNRVCQAPCPMSMLVMVSASRSFSSYDRLSMLTHLEANSQGAPPYIRARLLDELGFYHTAVLQRPAAGLAYHRDVVSMGSADVWTIHGIGEAFRGLGMPDSASQYFNLELVLARRLGIGWSEAYALGNLGQNCQYGYVPPRVECAVYYYDRTIALLVRLLREMGSDDNRAASAEYAAAIYQDAVFAELAYAITFGKAQSEQAALVMSDIGKSIGLLDYLRDQTDTVLPVGDPEGSFRTVLTPAAAYDVLQVGDSNTFALSYFVGSDTLLMWLVFPDRSVRLTRRAISSDSVAALVAIVRQELGVSSTFVGARMRGTPLQTLSPAADEDPMLSSRIRTASSLLLPADIEALVPLGADLIIVPQTVLALLPFTVLPLPGGGPGDLGARYAIRYAPSLRVMRDLERAHSERHTSAPGTTSLVLGNPKMPKVDVGELLEGAPDGLVALSALPASQSEGEWVAKRLESPLLSGSSATETELRSALPQADIVHLATHAVVTRFFSSARQSFLAAAPDESNDGLLTIGELLELPQGAVSARLVVLSACQTAVGPVRYVEGPMGLQRAFLAKGAESVLASLWSVNDESTSMLMQRFYFHWLDDVDKPTKAESLRRAQEEVRRVPGFEHPIYWGGFQLIGLN